VLLISAVIADKGEFIVIVTNRAHEDSIKLRMFFRELAIANFEFPQVNFRNEAIADFDQRFSSIFHEKNRICEQPYLRN